MSTIFFHNITKDILNEREFSDFINSYEEGDAIFTSEGGSAIICKLKKEELIKLKKYYQDDTDNE